MSSGSTTTVEEEPTDDLGHAMCCEDASVCDYCGRWACSEHDEDADECYGLGAVHRQCHIDSDCRQSACGWVKVW